MMIKFVFASLMLLALFACAPRYEVAVSKPFKLDIIDADGRRCLFAYNGQCLIFGHKMTIE